MDKLIFKVKRPERKGSGNVVRISEDAMQIIEDIQAKTGHAISYIASEMIIFADDHCMIDYGEE